MKKRFCFECMLGICMSSSSFVKEATYWENKLHLKSTILSKLKLPPGMLKEQLFCTSQADRNAVLFHVAMCLIF